MDQSSADSPEELAKGAPSLDDPSLDDPSLDAPSLGDLINRAGKAVNRRRLAQWQAIRSAERPRLYLKMGLVVVAGAALVGLLFGLIDDIEIAFGLSILPVAVAFGLAYHLLQSGQEANTELLLERLAPILRLNLLQPVGTPPPFIRSHQKFLPDFGDSTRYQAGFDGHWRGVDFEIVELIAPGDEDEDTEWGLIVALPMKTRLKARVEVRQDGGRLVNAIARKFDGNRVAIDQRRFENQYEVYSEDERRARRLLTPDFAETLLDLPSIDGAKPWTMVFGDGYMMVGWWSDYDILPAFKVQGQTLYQVQRVARRCARMLATPHMIIEQVNLDQQAGALASLAADADHARREARAEARKRAAEAEAAVKSVRHLGS